MKKLLKKVLTFSYLGCIIVTYSDEQLQNELRTEESLENIETTITKTKNKNKQKNKRKIKGEIKMKKSIKTRIISIATAALMTLSVATATMASASAATVEGTSVSAYQNTTVKVNLSTEWKTHNARYAAYFFNEYTGENAWADVKCSGYMGSYATAYGDFTHVIFVRLNNEGRENNFVKGNAWNKTADLKLSDLNGVYTINGWELEVE